MAYAMVAGCVPFEGMPPGEVQVKHLTAAPPPLRALCAEMEQLGAAVAGTATCNAIAEPPADETAVPPGAQVPLVRPVPTRHA